MKKINFNFSVLKNSRAAVFAKDNNFGEALGSTLFDVGSSIITVA